MSRDFIRCSAALLAMAAAGVQAQAPVVVTTVNGEAQPYLGHEHRALLNELAGASAVVGPEETLRRLQPVLDCAATPVHVSVNNDEEAKAFLAEHGLKAEEVVLIDRACPSAYKLVAFEAFEMKAPERALLFLDKAVTISPYSAEAYNERGFVLNQIHRPKEGAEAYRKSLEILEQHPQAGEKPVALRGLGFSLVDLGDLAGARKAYEQSLEVDPGNRTARSEIEYIDGELAKAAAKPAAQ